VNQTTQNIWQIEYTSSRDTNESYHNASIKLNKEQPSKYYRYINFNDRVGRIEIYDAKRWGFDTRPYTATFFYPDIFKDPHNVPASY